MPVDIGWLAVTGIGVSTHLGQDWATTQSALTGSRRPGYRRLRSFLGSDFAPQVAAFAAEPERGQMAPHRMTALASQAVDDLVTTYPGVMDVRMLILAILLPEPAAQEGLSDRTLTVLGQMIAADVGARTGLVTDKVSVHQGGHSALAQTLSAHANAISRGMPLLAVGVDSFACRQRLAARSSAGQLFSSRHPYAQVPSEAAAAVLFEAAPTVPAILTLSGLGLQTEPVGEDDDGHSNYGAQSDAAYDALKPLGDGASVDWVMTDWGNSRYRASELAHTLLRLKPCLNSDAQISHVPLIFGDIGAALLPLAIAIAAHNGAGTSLLLAGGRNNRLRAGLSLIANT